MKSVLFVCLLAVTRVCSGQRVDYSFGQDWRSSCEETQRVFDTGVRIGTTDIFLVRMPNEWNTPVVSKRAGDSLYAPFGQYDSTFTILSIDTAFGSLFVNGYFLDNGETSRFLHRYQPDGTEISEVYGYRPSPFHKRVVPIGNDHILVVGAIGVGVRRRLADKVSLDGQVDSSFVQIVPNTYGVSAAVRDNEGNILVSGDFTVVNGRPSNGFVRIRANGDLDSSSPIVTQSFQSAGFLVVDPKGGILVSTKDKDHRNMRQTLRRVRSDGSMDEESNYEMPDGEIIDGLLLATTDTLVVVLTRQTAKSNVVSSTFGVSRQPTGNQPGKLTARCIGRMFRTDWQRVSSGEIHGSFREFDGYARNGSLLHNEQFEVISNDHVPCEEPGEVYDIIPGNEQSPWFVSTNILSAGGKKAALCSKLDIQGSVETSSVIPVGMVVKNAIVNTQMYRRMNGDIVHVTNYADTIGLTTFDKYIVHRIESTGITECLSQLNDSIRRTLLAVCPLTTGGVIIGGRPDDPGLTYRTDWLQLVDDNGIIDTSFRYSLPDSARITAIAATNDTVYIAITIGVQSTRRTTLVRILPDGEVDGTFDKFPVLVSDLITRILPLSRGSVAITGTFQNITVNVQSNLCIVDPDGSLNTSRSPLIYGYYDVTNVVESTDGGVVVSGNFTEFETPSGTVRSPGIVRFTSTGALDSSFTSPIHSGLIRSSRLVGDSVLMVVGDFLLAADDSRANIIRLQLQDGISSVHDEIRDRDNVKSFLHNSDVFSSDRPCTVQVYNLIGQLLYEADVDAMESVDLSACCSLPRILVVREK